MTGTLHVVSPEKGAIETIATVNALIHPYVDYLHIRKKQWPISHIEQLIKELLERGVPKKKLLVNNQPNLVVNYELGGVHFPEHVSLKEDETSNLFKGSSVHSLEMAQTREKEGADYLFFGHIYETNSKPGLPPRGLSQLQSVVEGVSIPVIAIGGITPTRVQECLHYGASGVAVMSPIYEAEDPVSVVKAYRSSLR